MSGVDRRKIPEAVCPDLNCRTGAPLRASAFLAELFRYGLERVLWEHYARDDTPLKDLIDRVDTRAQTLAPGAEELSHALRDEEALSVKCCRCRATYPIRLSQLLDLTAQQEQD